MRSVIKRALLYSFNDTTCMYMSDSPSYDLLNISNFLVQKCQFDSKNIKIMSKFSRKCADKNNIEDHLRWLIKDCIPGDILFFYYSGLGFCINQDKDISQGICYIDERFGVISDEWMYDKILLKIPDGVTFWGFMDCCHAKINKLRFNIEYNLDQCIKEYVKLKYNEDDTTDETIDDTTNNTTRDITDDAILRQIDIASRESFLSGYFQDEDTTITKQSKQKLKQELNVNLQTDSHNQPLLQYDRFVETSNHEAVLSGYFDETDELENECDLDLNESKDEIKDESKHEIKDEIKNKYDYEYNDRYNDNYWVNNYIINIDLKKNRYPPRVYLFTGYLDFDKIKNNYTRIMVINKLQGPMTRAFLDLVEKECVTQSSGEISFKSDSLTVKDILKQLNYRLYLAKSNQRVVLSCNILDMDVYFNLT